ncbi:hypothetical protein KJZ61_00455 [Candidatus Dependentiae bacterium]|nr:hypothetical protein [Candidatus Dependentiae bacterium]
MSLLLVMPLLSMVQRAQTSQYLETTFDSQTITSQLASEGSIENLLRLVNDNKVTRSDINQVLESTIWRNAPQLDLSPSDAQKVAQSIASVFPYNKFPIYKLIANTNAQPLSPDGKHLAVIDGGCVKIWDFTKGMLERIPIERVEDHSDNAISAQWSSTGKQVIINQQQAPCGSKIVVFDLEKRTPRVAIKSEREIKQLQICADGKHIAIVSGDTATIFSLETMEKIKVIRHDNELIDAQISPSGEYIVTIVYDGTLRLFSMRDSFMEKVRAYYFWPEKSKKEHDQTSAIFTLNTKNDACEIQFSPNSKYMAVVCSDGKLRANTVKIFKLARREEIATTEYDGPVNSMSFSSDGNYLATTSLDCTACVLNLNTKLCDYFNDPSGFSSMQFSSDNYVLAASRSNGIKIFDLEMEEEPTTLIAGNHLKSAYFSHDEKFVIAMANAQVFIIDGEADNEVFRMPREEYSIVSMQLSPSGRHLIINLAGGLTRVISLGLANQPTKRIFAMATLLACARKEENSNKDFPEISSNSWIYKFFEQDDPDFVKICSLW